MVLTPTCYDSCCFPNISVFGQESRRCCMDNVILVTENKSIRGKKKGSVRIVGQPQRYIIICYQKSRIYSIEVSVRVSSVLPGHVKQNYPEGAGFVMRA